MTKKWEFYETNNNNVEQISNDFGVSGLVAKVLVNRNIIDKEKIEVFLKPSRYDFYDPFLMPDMKLAVDEIINAISKNTKTSIYGDYDVDGITIITVLK